jgi:hypothetical protein
MCSMAMGTLFLLYYMGFCVRFCCKVWIPCLGHISTLIVDCDFQFFIDECLHPSNIWVAYSHQLQLTFNVVWWSFDVCLATTSFSSYNGPSPHGKFKPAIFQIGNVPWSSQKYQQFSFEIMFIFIQWVRLIIGKKIGQQ